MASPNDTGSEPETFGLRRSELKQFVGEVYARRWVFVAFVVLTVAGTAAWVFRQPKVYQATCVIEYDMTPERPLGSAVETSDPVENIWMSQEFYETQNQILMSQSVAKRAVQALGLQRDLDFLYGAAARGRTRRPMTVDQAARVLRSRLTVALVRRTRLVEVKVEDTNPRRAARIANAIVTAHVEKTIEDRLDSTLRALDWLQGQLVTVRTQLEGSELALHDFKQENNILSVSLEDRQNMITNELEGLTHAVTDARVRRIAAAARVTELRSANTANPLEAHSVAIDESAEVRGLRDRYHDREAQCRALATRYGAEHPEILACQRELDSLKDAMRETIRGILRSSESTLREVQQTERGLSGALEQVNQAGLALNLREIDYARLLRERETNSKLYGILLDRTAETNLTRFLRVAFLRIVDEADAPTSPIKPRKTLSIGVAALVGLLLGLLTTLVLRVLDRTLASPEEVASLEIAVLGVVPQVESAQKPTPSPTRERKPVSASGAGIGLETIRAPRSAFAECFRLIRTNVSFLAVGKPLRTVLITSPGPGDGKTTVSLNLCAAFAQNNMRVLLVDADLRRPNVHRSLGVPNDSGVSTILVGDATLDECIRSTEVPGFDIVTAGAMPPNPSELLHGEPFAKLVDEMLSKYDRVVFDSPPVGVVADGLVMAAMAAGTILVARPGVTPRDLLRQSLGRLKAADAHVLGCVINAVKQTDLSYGSGSYHYTMSGYYGAAR